VQPPLHPREAERLAELQALLVLDTPSEGAFDRLTKLACRITGYKAVVQIM
jgi:hypothetical protein